MIIDERTIKQTLKMLEQIKNDFSEWKETSISKKFLQTYNTNYFIAQAILDKHMLKSRPVIGNKRKKEYIWNYTDPDKKDARAVLERYNEMKEKRDNKTPDFTRAEMVELLQTSLSLSKRSGLAYENTEQLTMLVELVEYILHHERDTKLTDIKTIIEKY